MINRHIAHHGGILPKGNYNFEALFLLFSADRSQGKGGWELSLPVLKNIAAAAVAVYNAERFLCKIIGRYTLCPVL
jgi:hypothetical protein